MPKRVLLIFILLPVLLSAARTRITSNLISANGVPFNGQVTISWDNFTTATGSYVVKNQVIVNIRNGIFSVELEPNVGAIPSGTSYQVQYSPFGKVEFWVVPVSATSVTVQSVVTSTIPNPNMILQPSQIARDSATDLQVMSWSDALNRWAPRSLSGSGITSLNGLPGATQTFGNDTNVTIVSSGSTHTVTWAGALVKTRQHAQTAYKDEANIFSLAQTINGVTTDLLTFNNSGASDWVTFTGNKSRFKVWNSVAVGLAEFQALTFFGSGSGLNAVSVPTAALTDGVNLPTSDQKAALAGTNGIPSTTNKYVTNSDPRNSDARVPSAHQSTHLSNGSDPIAAASTTVRGSATTTTANSQVVSTDDSRMTDARTPTAHAASHKNAGSDEVATATATANAIPKAGAGATLAAGWLPNPAAAALGGVNSKACPGSNWVSTIGTDGSVTCTRPACVDLSNAAASCSTDTTVANNITSGSLPAAQNTVLINTVDQGYFYGFWVQPPESTGSTTVFTANVHRVWQFVLPFTATINQVDFEVVIASGICGGTCSLGFALWNSACTTVMVNSGVMTSGGSPDINTTGSKIKTVSGGPVTLSPGVYWLAMTTDSTVLTVRSGSFPTGLNTTLNAQTNKKAAQTGNAGSAGTFPASCGTVTTGITNAAPLVLFER